MADAAMTLDVAKAALSSLIATAAEQPEAEAMLGALDALHRDGEALLSSVWQQQAEAARKQLKAQKQWYEVKLETARKAANVSLKQQEVQLVAEHHVKLESSIKELSSGGDKLLHDAHEKIEALSEELAELKVRQANSEGVLSTTTALLRRSEGQTKAAQAEAATLRAELAAANEGLATITTDLEASRAETASVKEELEAAGEAHKEALGAAEVRRLEMERVWTAARAQVDALEEELTTLKGESSGSRAELEAQVEELAMRVEAANERGEKAEEECARLQGEVQEANERARLGGADEAKRRQEELEEREAMEAAHEEEVARLREEVAEVHRRNEQGKAALKEAQAAMYKKEKELEAAKDGSKDSGKWLQQAQAEVARLTREAEVTRKGVKDVLKEAGMASLMSADDATIEGAMQTLHVAHRDARKELTASLDRVTAERDEVTSQLEELQQGSAGAAAAAEAQAAEIERLTSELTFATERFASLEAEFKKLTATAGAQQAQVDRWRVEAQRLEWELSVTNDALAKAKESGGDAAAIKATLEAKLATSEAALKGCEAELAKTQAALKERLDELSSAHGDVDSRLRQATSQLERLKEASKDERNSLVRTALGSLRQLREHLVTTLTGLKAKVHEPLPEPFYEKNLRSHRWGYVQARDGEHDHGGGGGAPTTDTLVIRLEPPRESLPIVRSYSTPQLPQMRQSSHPRRSALGANPLTAFLADRAGGSPSRSPPSHRPSSVVAACSPQSRPSPPREDNRTDEKIVRESMMLMSEADKEMVLSGCNWGQMSWTQRRRRLGVTHHQRAAVTSHKSPVKGSVMMGGAEGGALPPIASRGSPSPTNASALQPWTRPQSQEGPLAIAPIFEVE